MNALEARCEVLEDHSASIVRHANRLQRNIYAFVEEIQDDQPDRAQIATVVEATNESITSLLALISGSIAVLRDTVEENL